MKMLLQVTILVSAIAERVSRYIFQQYNPYQWLENVSRVSHDASPFNSSTVQAEVLNRLVFPTVSSQDDESYNIDMGKKLAIVFNHSHYKTKDVYARPGTKKDVEAIKQTFGQRKGFEVKIKDNPTLEVINNSLKEVAIEDNLSCFALFILTHGDDQGQLQADDVKYKFDETILENLLPQNCPSLAGKPKLIFVQACQGTKIDKGFTLRVKQKIRRSFGCDGYTVDSEKEVNMVQAVNYSIPNHTDLLTYFASFKEHVSIRGSEGSWMIQTLCKVLDEAKDEDDLETILTRTARKIAILEVDPSHQLHGVKQVPLKQGTLIRKIYFASKTNLELEEENERITEIRETGNNEEEANVLVQNQGHNEVQIFVHEAEVHSEPGTQFQDLTDNRGQPSEINDLSEARSRLSEFEVLSGIQESSEYQNLFEGQDQRGQNQLERERSWPKKFWKSVKKSVKRKRSNN